MIERGMIELVRKNDELERLLVIEHRRDALILKGDEEQMKNSLLRLDIEV